MKELVQVRGLSEYAIRARIKKGYPLEGKLKGGFPPRKLQFRGTLATYQEIAAATGLSVSGVKKRHDGKRFFEDEDIAASKDLYPKEPRIDAQIITCRGISDSLLRMVAPRRHSTKHDYSRLAWGWTVEQALFGFAYPRYRFQGKVQPLREWAKEYGIPTPTLYQRLHYWHWPIERALTEPSGKQEHTKRKVTLLRMVALFNEQAGGSPKSF